MNRVNIPALLNQLLATVTSAAKPSTNSFVKNFILYDEFYYSFLLFLSGTLEFWVSLAKKIKTLTSNSWYGFENLKEEKG